MLGNVIARLEKGKEAQFQEKLVELFPNRFSLDPRMSTSVEEQALYLFEEIAIVEYEGIEMLEFIVKPFNTMVDGIEFYIEWAPDSYIANPPSILCWWD